MGIVERVPEEKGELGRFIILLANANDEPIRGRMKLQKMMCFLSRKVGEVKGQSGYGADRYGPYSETVDREERHLERTGVLACDNSGNIALTETGKEMAWELSKNEDRDTLESLDDYKEFLNDLTGEELLAYVYSAHPDMVEESAEYENLKPHMERHVMSLIKKQKISAERGAELLDRPLYHVIQKIRNGQTVVLEQA